MSVSSEPAQRVFFEPVCFGALFFFELAALAADAFFFGPALVTVAAAGLTWPFFFAPGFDVVVEAVVDAAVEAFVDAAFFLAPARCTGAGGAP